MQNRKKNKRKTYTHVGEEEKASIYPTPSLPGTDGTTCPSMSRSGMHPVPHVSLYSAQTPGRTPGRTGDMETRARVISLVINCASLRRQHIIWNLLLLCAGSCASQETCSRAERKNRHSSPGLHLRPGPGTRKEGQG